MKTDENEKFVYHHNEFGLIDSDIISNEKSEYDSFQEPFLLIHSAYPWYQLHLTIVHKDYRDYIAEELIRLLNKFDMKWDLLAYSKKNLENILDISIHFGHTPQKNGLQNITVTHLMKVTEYEYKEYTEASGKTDRIIGTYDIWTEEQIYNSQNQEIIRQKYE